MRLIKKKILFFAAFLLLINSAGCGYTTHSSFIAQYKTIYVPQFVNKIDITKEEDNANKYKLYRPFLEQDVTQAVINRFLFDGNLKPSKAQAPDLTLTGELAEFRLDPLRYDSSQNVQEYRINIVVNFKLTDNKENKLLWEENNFTGDTSYFTTSTLQKSEPTAINDALADLARRVVERVVEQW